MTYHKAIWHVDVDAIRTRVCLWLSILHEPEWFGNKSDMWFKVFFVFYHVYLWIIWPTELYPLNKMLCGHESSQCSCVYVNTGPAIVSNFSCANMQEKKMCF